MKLFFWKKSNDPEIEKKENIQSNRANPPVPAPEPKRIIPKTGEISKSTNKKTSTDGSNQFGESRKTRLVVKRETMEDSFGSQRKGVASVSKKPKPQEVVIQQIAGPTQHRVLPIKRWCERELTPVAWARILVRILPVLRQYGYSFAEMQNPAPDTQVKQDFYYVISATIQEIYELTYEDTTAA